MKRLFVHIAVVTAMFAARSHSTSFHLMQIEQVIGGVAGDVTAQAIQLRMRFGSQNFVQSAVIDVWDAAGTNPVRIIDFQSAAAVGIAGRRILIVSPNFPVRTHAVTVPDFTMDNVIPPSYLDAGSLTFGTPAAIYWRLSWGGASYTGATTGTATNDATGEFGPPYAGGLPKDGTQGLLFQGAAGDISTSNSVDYALTSGAAVVTNNSGDTFTVVDPVPVEFSTWGAIKELYRQQ